MKTIHSRLSLSLTFLVFAGGCAKQSAPPSGVEFEADKVHAALTQPAQVEKAPSAAPAVSPDTPVMSVNDQVFTISEVMTEASRMIQNSGRRWTKEQMQQIAPALQRDARQSLVNRYLILEAAKAKGVEVPPSAVQAELDKLKASLPEGIAFEDVLAERGTDKATLIGQLRDELLVAFYQNNLMKEVAAPSSEDLQAHYDENLSSFVTPEQRRCRHLFKAFTPEMDEAAKDAIVKKLEALRASLLRDGSDFVALIERHSDAPDKSRGGEVVMSRGAQPESFQDLYFDMKTNEFSEVIVGGQGGAHLIQMLEHIPERQLAFDEVKVQLAQALHRNLRTKALAEDLQTLWDAAEIQDLINLPEEESSEAADATTPVDTNAPAAPATEAP